MPQPLSTASASPSAAREPDAAIGGAGVRGVRLARRLVSNYVFQMMNLGIRLFDQLLLIPLYILAWGTELYKDWLVLTAIVWFLNTCSFGIDDYFGTRFIRAVAGGDGPELRRQMRLGLFVSSMISLLILLLLYGFLLTVDVTALLGLSAMSRHTARLVLVVMTFPLWGWYSVMILHVAYRAYGDFSRGECIFAIYSAAQLIGVMIALSLRAPPVVVACCYGSMPIICSVATLVDVCRRYRGVRLGFAVPTWAEWRQIVPQSLLYFTNTLSMALTQNVTLVVFALYNFSAEAIVTFNVCRVFTGLTRQIGAQSFAIGSGIEMARQHVQNDHDGCRRLYADTGRIVSCIAGVLSGISIPLSVPFIHLWTHGAVSADMVLILCFLAGIAFSSPGRAALMLLRYTNHARAIAWANSVYSIGGLALAVVLAWPLGGWGVALGFALTETLGVGVYPLLMVERRFHFGAVRYLLNSFLTGAAAFALSYAVAWLLFHHAEIGLFGLALRAAVWAGLVIPPAIILILPREQRARLLAVLSRLLVRHRLARPG